MLGLSTLCEKFGLFPGLNSRNGGSDIRLGKAYHTATFLSTRGVRKPTSMRVGDSPSVAFPAPMTRTLDTDGFADLRLVSTPQEKEKQFLGRLQRGGTDIR